MLFLRSLSIILLILFLFTSCAKISYLIEQGSGQLGLQSRAKPNAEVLNSVRVPKTHKEKIKKIEELKKYFYAYYEKKETRIYSRTTYLRSRAVTHLVIASPFDKIATKDSCFPLMGCFPYLGFFEKKSAEEYALELRRKDLVTYIRPVYAYSTLGYFEDTILSSFFKYNDLELAELIFHELFHTIFFATNEVDLNENLANFFSEKMTEEYFLTEKKEKDYQAYKESLKKSEQVDQRIVALATELQMEYQKNAPLDRTMATEIITEFLRTRFYPEIRKTCDNLKALEDECYPLKREWNNASFAAFLTYEKKANQLEILMQKKQMNLRNFYQFLVKEYDTFKESSTELPFSEFLFR